jgi:hypothetical protein
MPCEPLAGKNVSRNRSVRRRPLLHGERRQKTLGLNVGVIHLRLARRRPQNAPLRVWVERTEQEDLHRLSLFARTDCRRHEVFPCSSTGGDGATIEMLDPKP